MKKVVIIILNLLLLSLIFLFVISNKNYEEKVNKNQEINDKIDNIENIINDKIKQNETLEAEINNLKEQYKKELEEQDIWKNMKEKIEQALS